jgi:hypothetical protein
MPSEEMGVNAMMAGGESPVGFSLFSGCLSLPNATMRNVFSRRILTVSWILEICRKNQNPFDSILTESAFLPWHRQDFRARWCVYTSVLRLYLFPAI